MVLNGGEERLNHIYAWRRTIPATYSYVDRQCEGLGRKNGFRVWLLRFVCVGGEKYDLLIFFVGAEEFVCWIENRYDEK
jgi:hypothetical protein